MDNQRIFGLWTDFKKNIWKQAVQAGRKNAALRAILLAVVAVGLFMRHLTKYMQATPFRRFVSVCCAGALILNSVHFPVHVWATEQAKGTGNWVADEMEGDDTRGLIVEVKKPAEPIVEGYEGLIQYQVKIVNPVSGDDLSVIGVQAHSAEVYLVTESGEKKLEDCFIEDDENLSTEESSEESTEESSEESTEESSEESTEESSEESTEENNEEPSTEESSETLSTETEGEESTEENGEEPSTEGSSETLSPEAEGDGLTEENREDLSAEENREGPTAEDGSEESAEENGEDSLTEESGEGLPTEGVREIFSLEEDGAATANEARPMGDDNEMAAIEKAITAMHLMGAQGAWKLPAGGEMLLNVYFAMGLSAGIHVEKLTICTLESDEPIVKYLSVVVNEPEQESETSEMQPDTQEEPETSEMQPDTQEEPETSEMQPDAQEEPETEGTEQPAEPSGGGGDASAEPSGGGADMPAEPSGGGADMPAEPSGGGSGADVPAESPAGGTEMPGTEDGKMPADQAQAGAETEVSPGGGNTEDRTEESEMPEDPLEEDPCESEESEEPEETEEPEEGVRSPLEVLSRDGGFHMGKTFFAVTGTVFELAVDQETVAALFCELDGVTEELTIEDGCAFFAIPETCDGMLRFYTMDGEGNVNGELTEYVIAETEAPILDYMNVTSSTDKKEMVRITIEDCGDVISGLNEIRCEIDGVPYTEYMTAVFGRATLSSGEKVISGISFDIPLTDIEIHTIAVYASDQVGNILEKKFRVHSSQRDIVSVVLPTSFGMAIFPYSSNGNIWGDDIVIANQGDFPIEVTLKSAQIDIDHNGEKNIDKDAKLSLNMFLSEGRDSEIDLEEGYSTPGTYFVLGPKNPNTDAEMLQNNKSEKQVASEDYAIVNVRGVISEGSERFWKTGDITVSLTFTFKRLEEEDEVIE